MKCNQISKMIGVIAAEIYMFLIFVTSDNAMLLIASLILFVGYICINLKEKKLHFRLSLYFCTELAFVVYCILQYILSIVVLGEVSVSTIRRLMINLIDEFMLYNILIHLNDVEDVLDVLVLPYVIGLGLIVMLRVEAGSLLHMRLTANSMTRVWGITINAGAATIIAHCAICAFAFGLICGCAKKKKIYFVLDFLVFCVIVLTASRKAIAVALVLILAIPNIKWLNRKGVLRIFGGICLFATLCIAIVKIPALYSLVGVRFERMLLSIYHGNLVDSSMGMRESLRIMAMDAFIERPIEGWGVNAFKELFNGGKLYSHNNYLEIMVGTGIIGMAIYLTRYIYLFIRLLCALKSKSDCDRYYAKMMLIWMIMVWIMEYWQVVYYNERMIGHYIFVLAVADRILHRNKREKRMAINQYENYSYYSIR